MPSVSSEPAFPADPFLVCPECGVPMGGSASTRACRRCAYRCWRADGFWDTDAAAAPAGFTEDRREHLGHLEGRHFWFPPRDRLVLGVLDGLRPRWPSAIEIGCGTGRLLPALAGRADVVFGVDQFAASVREAAGRCPEAVLLRADARRVPLAPRSLDLVIALDVLEHVEPDRLLGEARRLLRPGGLALLSVPAFPILWSAADERAGHRARYRVESLQAELEDAGFALRGHTHYQFLLFPAMVLSRRLLGSRGATLERRPPRLLSRALARVNEVEVRLLGRRQLPFGSSLVAWAERTE
jgi:SAM-dependent methyltransferase